MPSVQQVLDVSHNRLSMSLEQPHHCGQTSAVGKQISGLPRSPRTIFLNPFHGFLNAAFNSPYPQVLSHVLKGRVPCLNTVFDKGSEALVSLVSSSRKKGKQRYWLKPGPSDFTRVLRGHGFASQPHLGTKSGALLRQFPC